MSYYGYVERKPEDVQVNWGEISQGIIKSVQDWEKGREDLKEKLDKETRETQKAISEIPETKSEPIQTWILDTATTASERLAELNRKLKSNQITPRNYNLLRSNIMSDVTGVYAFAKAYDQGYAAKLQRVSDGKAGYVERKTAEDTENFIGNSLSDLTPFIDETGTLMYKKPDGSSMSYRQIVKNSSIKQDNKNAVLNITKYAQSMKAHEVRQPDGSYKSSPSLNEDAKRAIDSYAAQFLINPNDVADILFDAGKREGFEIKDGNVVITDKDRQDAKQVLIDAAYGTFGMQVTPAPRESIASSGSSGDKPDKPTEADEKAIRYGQALKNLTTNANKSVLSQNIGMPKGTYDGTNKVLTTYDKDGKKYVTRFNSGVEAMDFLITQSGYDPAYVKRGLGNANSLGGFSWDFSAKQETPKPKVVDLVKESDDLENWAYKLNEKDSNTKGKIYYSKNKTIVVKYPDGTYGESDDLEEINEYIKKYNRLTR
jgi:hypothetical protein